MKEEKEILKKLLEAKRLEGEALLLLLPDSMQQHLKQIGRECIAMAGELVFDALKKRCDTDSDPEQEKRVKKVHISEE